MAFAHSQVSTHPSYLTAFKKFMVVVPSLTLATTVTATALILWRIWCVFLILARIPCGLELIDFCYSKRGVLLQKKSGASR